MKKTENDNNEYGAFNSEWIPRVEKKLIWPISRWLFGSYIGKEPEDIASEAVMYAITPGLTGKGPYPATEQHLFLRAKKIARFKVLSEIAKAKRGPEYSLDARPEDEDGDNVEPSKAELAYIMQLYYEKQKDAEKRALGRKLLRELDDFLQKKGVSKRDIKVFKAQKLYAVPVDIVCRVHNITPENLYRIVSVVKGVLVHNRDEFIADAYEGDC